MKCLRASCQSEAIEGYSYCEIHKWEDITVLKTSDPAPIGGSGISKSIDDTATTDTMQGYSPCDDDSTDTTTSDTTTKAMPEDSDPPPIGGSGG